MSELPTREQCIADAARTWNDTCERIAGMSPREQAKAAYRSGGPSVDELEARIRRQRGLPVGD